MEVNFSRCCKDYANSCTPYSHDSTFSCCIETKCSLWSVVTTSFFSTRAFLRDRGLGRRPGIMGGGVLVGVRAEVWEERPADLALEN